MAAEKEAKPPPVEEEQRSTKRRGDHGARSCQKDSDCLFYTHREKITVPAGLSARSREPGA